MSAAITKEIRHTYSLSESESLWKNEKPDLIVFSSSSVRKALIFSWALHDFSFDHVDQMGLTIKGPGLKGLTTPAEIQEYFNTYIYNGDMALRQQVFLGEFEGVPVWAYPQTTESDKNDDPIAEARNKATAFADQFAGRNVFFIASDVVGTSSNFIDEVGTQIKMGKPINFRSSLEVEAAEQGSQTPLWESPEAFIAWYKEVVFEVNSTLGHISGVVVLDAAEHQLYATEVELYHQLSAELHQHLEVLSDAGLGGAWQQIQAYLQDSLTLLGDAVVDIIPTHADPDEETTEQLVFAHMIGVQVLAFLELLVGVQRDEVAVLSAKKPVQNLIFDGESR